MAGEEGEAVLIDNEKVQKLIGRALVMKQAIRTDRFDVLYYQRCLVNWLDVVSDVEWALRSLYALQANRPDSTESRTPATDSAPQSSPASSTPGDGEKT